MSLAVKLALSPLLVAELVTPLGWGRTLSLMAVVPLVSLAMIWLWLPETAGQELDDAANLPR
jgi:hypothetical protein